MTAMKKLFVGLSLICLVAIQAFPPALSAGTEGTIYDSQILTRMKFAAEQLPPIKEILDEAEARIVKIFAKYRIDPKAKPDFDLLRAASLELQEIESWENNQMKQILSKSQYADYLEIRQATAAAVIKATRDD